MKSNLNCTAGKATQPLRPEVKRANPALSPQNPPRQVAAKPAVMRSLRAPVSVENRAYLKALRQAELAAWQAAKPHLASASALASVRLPMPRREARENVLYALLAVPCLAAVGHELWATFQAGGNWQNFVEFVRVLLS